MGKFAKFILERRDVKNVEELHEIATYIIDTFQKIYMYYYENSHIRPTDIIFSLDLNDKFGFDVEIIPKEAADIPDADAMYSFDPPTISIIDSAWYYYATQLKRQRFASKREQLAQRLVHLLELKKSSGSVMRSLVHEIAHHFDIPKRKSPDSAARDNLRSIETAKDPADFFRKYHRTPHERQAFFIEILHKLLKGGKRFDTFGEFLHEFIKSYDGWKYLRLRQKKAVINRLYLAYRELKQNQLAS